MIAFVADGPASASRGPSSIAPSPGSAAGLEGVELVTSGPPWGPVGVLRSLGTEARLADLLEWGAPPTDLWADSAGGCDGLPAFADRMGTFPIPRSCSSPAHGSTGGDPSVSGRSDAPPSSASAGIRHLVAARSSPGSRWLRPVASAGWPTSGQPLGGTARTRRQRRMSSTSRLDSVSRSARGRPSGIAVGIGARLRRDRGWIELPPRSRPDRRARTARAVRQGLR